MTTRQSHASLFVSLSLFLVSVPSGRQQQERIAITGKARCFFCYILALGDILVDFSDVFCDVELSEAVLLSIVSCVF